MDKMVGWGAYGRILHAISAIMTEQRYRQGGYALSSCIHNELERRGFSDNPEVAKRLGTTVPENLRARYLDEAIENMQRRDLPQVSDHCALSIRGIGADDVGYVDFAKLAFYLFGSHIRAFYYLFFLIYGLTLFVSLGERYRDLMGQIILLIVAGVIYASCYYSDFLLLPDPGGLGNMLNPRFMPVLALVPGLHLLLMLVDRVPPTWWRVAIVLFQSGIIFFTTSHSCDRHMVGTGTLPRRGRSLLVRAESRQKE